MGLDRNGKPYAGGLAFPRVAGFVGEGLTRLVYRGGIEFSCGKRSVRLGDFMLQLQGPRGLLSALGPGRNWLPFLKLKAGRPGRVGGSSRTLPPRSLPRQRVR